VREGGGVIATDDSSNVVEVDFRGGRGAHDVLDMQDTLLQQVHDILGEADRAIEWYEQQARADAWRRRRAEEALLRERELAFPFSDAEVLDATRRAYQGIPLAATEIAEALGARITHSVRVRAGLVLSRLWQAGMVDKAVPPTVHDTTRWAPAEVVDA
jgi:hypothetical protein